MNAHFSETQKRETTAIASVTSEKEHNDVPGFQFVDNRPEAREQRKLHEMAHRNQPISRGQEKRLPHEAWYVVQQKQGRVKPVLQLKNGASVNTQVSLEKEADQNGPQQLKLTIPGDRRRVLKQGYPSSNKIIQAVWKETDNPKIMCWDKLIDGLTWYSENGLMWFEIGDEKHIPPDMAEVYKAHRGQEHKKSWVEWNKIIVKPAPQFTADEEYKEPMDELGSDNKDGNWKKWDKYVNITIASVSQQDKLANVKKDPDFKGSPKLDADELRTMLDYVSSFNVTSRRDFNIKLWDMAEVLASLDQYSCIVSEPGKSNYWVTARVLKKVKILGGKAPLRIISVPTKEKGLKDKVKEGSLDIDLTGAGNSIVFMDDGAFSGSQLFKLVSNVVKNTKIEVCLGLVACSEMARLKLEKLDPEYLTQPIPIASAEHGPLELVHKKLKIPGKADVGAAAHGDHLSGFYYKIPDHASVRTSILTSQEDKGGRTAIKDYATKRFDESSGKWIPGTEPYKWLKDEDPKELNLEVASYKPRTDSSEVKADQPDMPVVSLDKKKKATPRSPKRVGFDTDSKDKARQ